MLTNVSIFSKGWMPKYACPEMILFRVRHDGILELRQYARLICVRYIGLRLLHFHNMPHFHFPFPFHKNGSMRFADKIVVD